MIHFNTENKKIKELIEQRKENHYKISELEFEKFNELYGIERKRWEVHPHILKMIF